MATTLTVTDMAGPYDGTFASPTFEAPTATTQAQFTITGDEVIVAHNKDATSARNVRLVSTDDDFGRQEDVTFSVPADTVVCKKIARTGWEDSSGNMSVSVATSDVNISIWKLP